MRHETSTGKTNAIAVIIALEKQSHRKSCMHNLYLIDSISISVSGDAHFRLCAFPVIDVS